MAPGGETVYCAGMTGNGGEAPAQVEFSPLGVEDYNVTSIEGESTKLSVSGVRTVTDELGGARVVG